MPEGGADVNSGLMSQLSIIIVIVEAGVVGEAATVATRRTGAAAGTIDSAGPELFQPSDRLRGDLDRFLKGGADGLSRAPRPRAPFFASFSKFARSPCPRPAPLSSSRGGAGHPRPIVVVSRRPGQKCCCRRCCRALGDRWRRADNSPCR